MAHDQTRRDDRVKLRAVWDDVRHRQAMLLDECAIFPVDRDREPRTLAEANAGYTVDRVIGPWHPDRDETEPGS